MPVNNHIAKLPNSPLQEVVFELFLEQEIDSNGRPIDEKYQFAQGVFHQKIKSQFPVRATAPDIPNIRVFPSIKHQFWTGINKWPVIQIGPGLMTVNDTELNYKWENFFPLIKDSIKNLEESYEGILNISKVSLKYIDAIEFPNANINEQLDFINLNFKLNLRNDFNIENSNQTGISINQTFEVSALGTVNFMIASGRSKNNLPSLIWQSQIINNSIKLTSNLNDWIDKGHDVLSDLFKKTITEDFYESFK